MTDETNTTDSQELLFEVEGCDPADIERGLAAARAVFEAAGLSPAEAFWAHHTVESFDRTGAPDPTPAEAINNLHVWRDAEAAALAALPERDGTRPRYSFRLG